VTPPARVNVCCSRSSGTFVVPEVTKINTATVPTKMTASGTPTPVTHIFRCLVNSSWRVITRTTTQELPIRFERHHFESGAQRARGMNVVTNQPHPQSNPQAESADRPDLSPAVGGTLNGSEGRAFGGTLRAPAPSSSPSAEWSVEGPCNRSPRASIRPSVPGMIVPATRPIRTPSVAPRGDESSRVSEDEIAATVHAQSPAAFRRTRFPHSRRSRIRRSSLVRHARTRRDPMASVSGTSPRGRP